MEIMLDKKQIQVIFLFELKMGCKSVNTTCNINNVFGEELLTNVQCRHGSKETRALKMRNTVAGHWNLTTTN